MKTACVYLFIISLTVVVGESVVSAQSAPRTTHGVASGDVTSSTAVVWARSDREAAMTVRYQPMVGQNGHEAA